MKLENFESLLNELAGEGVEITLVDARSEIESTLSCNSSGASGQGGGGNSGGGSGGGCRSGVNGSDYFYKG